LRLRLLPPAAKRLDAKNAAYRNFVAGLCKESSHTVNFSLLGSTKDLATLVNVTSGFGRAARQTDRGLGLVLAANRAVVDQVQ
jgi:hypothetical protein